MKRQKTIKFTTLFFSLSAALIFAGLAKAQLAPPCEIAESGFCTLLPEVIVPPSFSATSIGIAAPNLGVLNVNFKVKTYSNNVGNSKYRITLRKGAPGSNPAIASG